MTELCHHAERRGETSAHLRKKRFNCVDSRIGIVPVASEFQNEIPHARVDVSSVIGPFELYRICLYANGDDPAVQAMYDTRSCHALYFQNSPYWQYNQILK